MKAAFLPDDFLQSTHNKYNRMNEENKQKSCNNSQRNNIGTHIMVSILSIGIGSVLFAYVAFASTIHNGTQTSIQQVIFVSTYIILIHDLISVSYPCNN